MKKIWFYRRDLLQFSPNDNNEIVTLHTFFLSLDDGRKSENLQTQFVSWINFSLRFITFFSAILKILHFFCCRWLCNCVSVPLKKRRRLLTYVFQRLKCEDKNWRKQRKRFGRQIEESARFEILFFVILGGKINMTA